MTYAITHNDLDGTACAILLEKIFPDMSTFSVGYDELNDIIPSVLAKANGAKVFITDISLTSEQAEMCDRYGAVQHIDHHSSNKKISDQYAWSFTDVSHCATYHLYKMLSTYATLGDYEDFVNLVDDYDTWGHGTQPTEESRNLNRLLQMIGPETFVARFKVSASAKLTPSEVAIVAMDKYQEEKYLLSSLERTYAVSDNDGNSFLVIAAERYTSSLGNYLLTQFPETEYVVIINAMEDKISLRSRGNVDVGELAKSCGGGGHKKASGFHVKDFAVSAFLGGMGNEQRERGSSGDTTLD